MAGPNGGAPAKQSHHAESREAVAIDAPGIGLVTTHMPHGARAVAPELFSNELGLLVDGSAARASLTPEPAAGNRR